MHWYYTMFHFYIFKPRSSRTAAAYSDQTFTWIICWSVRQSVHRSVRALWKMTDRIWMPFRIIARPGPGMRHVVQFGDRSTGGGTFGGERGLRHCKQWGLYGVRVRQCLNRRSCGFGVVRAVGRGIAVLDWGSTSCKEKGRFWVFCSAFSQWKMPLGRRRWNVSDLYVKTWQHFCSANVSSQSSIRGLFGIIFSSAGSKLYI